MRDKSEAVRQTPNQLYSFSDVASTVSFYKQVSINRQKSPKAASALNDLKTRTMADAQVSL